MEAAVKGFMFELWIKRVKPEKMQELIDDLLHLLVAKKVTLEAHTFAASDYAKALERLAVPNKTGKGVLLFNTDYFNKK